MRVIWAGAALVVLAGSLRGQASLTGYVRDDETLRGLQGVELSVTGSDRRARTDKEGRYSLRDLPPGAIQIHLRFVGFAPIDTILTLADGKPTESVFFLARRAVPLDTVVSRSGQAPGAGFESFELRRARGFGRFMDSVYLRQHENQRLSELIISLGHVDVMKPSTCHGDHALWCDWRVAVSKRNVANTACLSQVVLDGHVVARGAVIDNRDAPYGASKQILEMVERRKEYGWGGAFNLNSIGVSALRGVEVYRSAADVQGIYGGDDAGCGVVVLWSRRG